MVVGACLRNAPAVGTWLAARLDAGATVAVVAAGERWPDGSLRPAVEDLWGAGAVLAGLAKEASDSQYSPEARSAVASYLEVAGGGLRERLRVCASGAELEARGFGDDVDLASEAGATDVVPVLRGQSFSAL